MKPMLEGVKTSEMGCRIDGDLEWIVKQWHEQWHVVEGPERSQLP